METAIMNTHEEKAYGSVYDILVLISKSLKSLI